MIRKFKYNDIDIIMHIWFESTIKGHKFITKSYWEKNFDAVKNIYIPMSETFIYEDNNKIKGFISILNDNFIGALFVDPNSQGKRIGSKLISYATNKYPNLELAVYKGNLNAINFYLNKGFKIESEQINEDSGHIEYIMKI